jgi:hypothetical protein
MSTGTRLAGFVVLSAYSRCGATQVCGSPLNFPGEGRISMANPNGDECGERRHFPAKGQSGA